SWIVVFVCYCLAFRLLTPSKGFSSAFRRWALIIAVGYTLLFSVVLIFMYPVGAADIFNYAFSGRLITHYSLNPFITTPIQLPNDPFFPYTAWRDLTSTYGPLWELMGGATGWLAGDSLWSNLILFKLLVVAGNF